MSVRAVEGTRFDRACVQRVGAAVAGGPRRGPRGWLWGMLLLAAWIAFGCSEPPTDAAVTRAPRTAAEQRAAVEDALARAEASGEWVRAEAALEALMVLEPERDVALRREHLRQIRRHRRIAEGLDEVAALLEAGAWRAAEGWLVTLEQSAGGLDERERARVAELREIAGVLRAEEQDRRGLPPATP